MSADTGTRSSRSFGTLAAALRARSSSSVAVGMLAAALRTLSSSSFGNVSAASFSAASAAVRAITGTRSSSSYITLGGVDLPNISSYAIAEPLSGESHAKAGIPRSARFLYMSLASSSCAG